MSAMALYARVTPGHDHRLEDSLALLRHAAREHRGTIVQATSLGAEDMVITDLIARHRLPVAVATLETGALHAQTLALADRIERHYGIEVERWSPRPEAVVHFVRDHGTDAMYRSLALRKACCGVRKLEPLQRLLQGRTAWVTGLRREQSDARADVPVATIDAEGRAKLNVLADWSWADVWHYIATHQVPYNALHDQFFPSIGCQPCTRAIAVGEDFRAGRWWWEQSSRECGLHVAPSANTPAVDDNAISNRPSLDGPATLPLPLRNPA
ncbi:MAG: phosphoadenylyl-sulfate reductase [Rubrivivax sp.]